VEKICGFLIDLPPKRKMNSKMPPKRKMNATMQKVAKSMTFYVEMFQSSLNTIRLFKKLQRESLQLRLPGGSRRRMMMLMMMREGREAKKKEEVMLDKFNSI